MSKRKPISIINSLGRVNSLPSIDNSRLVSTESILSMANKLKDKYSNEAYNIYNASLFPEIKTNVESIQFEQPTIEVQEKPLSYNKSKKTSSSYKGSKNDFINNIYNSYYKAVRPGAASDADADRQARFLTQKAAFETDTGSHIVNTHNYGGHRINGKWLAFDSMDDFTKRDVALLDRKWSNWRNSKSDVDFVNAITTNTGRGHYAPRHEYQGYMNLTDKVNNTINMGRRKLRCGGKIDRPKAWIGAAIGAATSILGSVLSSNAQEKQQEELRRQQEHQAALKRAEGITESLGLMQAAQKEYENRFRVNYKNGGRRKLANGAKITDGGPVLNLSTGGLYYAGDKVPYGEYVDLGPTHEERNNSGKTGTGWNINGKKIETENKEVETISPTQMKVYSNSLELPNGMTPAEYVLNGGDKNYAFNVQQNMNGDYRISNKRRLRNGGCLSCPVERIKANDGIVVINGRKMKRVNYMNADGTVSDKTYLQDVGPADGGTSWWTNLKNRVKGVLNSKIQAPPAKRTTTGTRAVNPNAQTGPFYSSTMASVSKPKTVTSKQSASSSGVRGNNFSGNSGSGVRGNNQTVEEPITQSAYAQQYAKNNTRSLVVSSDTGTTNQPTRGASVSSDTDRRRLATRGQKSVPTVTAAIPTTSVYAPDYTEQQMLDYINSNRTVADNTQNNTYTDPNEAILREMASKDPNYNGTNTNVSGTTTELGDITGNTNKLGAIFKGSDWIEGVADLIGSFGSALINYNAAKNIGDPAAPVRYSPGKLITNWNIAPRLSEVDKTEYSMLKNTDDMFSSAGRNKAIQQIKIWGNQQRDKLWGEKTNREVELGNADTLNQQQVNAQNVAAYNDYLNRLYDARTRRGLMRSQALQVGLSGLSDVVGNFLDQGKQRYSDQQAMKYYTALLPESGRQWLKRNGVDFLRRGGRIK